MSRSAIIVDIAPTAVQALGPLSQADRLPPLLQYLLALVGVGLAVAVGLGMEALLPAANLTLLFVMPVMGMAVAFGWGPSMFAAICGALTFDFFFTEPKYSLAIASPADLWSAGLLLVVGAAVSTLAAQVRRRALEAERAAAQAKALQGLAHAVMTAAPRAQILETAAQALNEIFQAPAAILARGPAVMEILASAGQASLTSADRGAADTTIEIGAPTHGGAYPTDRARFDFWPVQLAGGETLAVGVNFTQAPDGHPQDAQGHVEAVCAYLAAASRPSAT